MSELNKTARASLGKVKKEDRVETTEEAIKAIRDNRAAKLFIGDMSRVDKLLAAYDQAVKELHLEKIKFESAADMIDWNGGISGKSMADHLPRITELMNSPKFVESVIMAEIPNHELDQTDFGVTSQQKSPL